MTLEYYFAKHVIEDEAARLLNPQDLPSARNEDASDLYCPMCLEQVKPWHQDECVVCRMRKAGV